MQGIGTLLPRENSFWKVIAANGERNPLNYRCAPNQATPDYVSSPSVRDFIAYGFVTCWDCLSPKFFTMWNMVEKDDLMWFRHNFLVTLEKLILAYYKGEVEIGHDQFDSEWDEDLNIGNADEGDEEEICYTWAPFSIHDDALALVLRLTNTINSKPAGDEEVIWLELDALQDRHAVKSAIDEAFQVNNPEHDRCCPGNYNNTQVKKEWAEVLV